jgi:hypothetical protein
MKENRKLFTKEGFLEGNRQRWLVIFLVYGSLIMGLDAFRLLKDVTPYFTYLSFLAGGFLLGYSGTETMKLFRASTITQDENITESSISQADINVNKNINEQVLTNNAKEDDYNIQGA